MEHLQTVVQDLYTNFVLRDLAGKIVPGALLAFSLSLLISKPLETLKLLNGKISTVATVVGAGILWVTVLGLQSIAESMGLLAYFPAVGDKSGEAAFAEATQLMQQFLANATPADKLQYERFVVIKEATGNLKFALLLSAPFWIYYIVHSWPKGKRKASVVALLKAGSTYLCIGFYTLVLVGVHRMNNQHIMRQYCLAALTLERTKAEAVSYQQLVPCKPHPENDQPTR